MQAPTIYYYDQHLEAEILKLSLSTRKCNPTQKCMCRCRCRCLYHIHLTCCTYINSHIKRPTYFIGPTDHWTVYNISIQNTFLMIFSVRCFLHQLYDASIYKSRFRAHTETTKEKNELTDFGLCVTLSLSLFGWCGHGSGVRDLCWKVGGILVGGGHTPDATLIARLLGAFSGDEASERVDLMAEK